MYISLVYHGKVLLQRGSITILVMCRAKPHSSCLGNIHRHGFTWSHGLQISKLQASTFNKSLPYLSKSASRKVAAFHPFYGRVVTPVFPFTTVHLSLARRDIKVVPLGSHSRTPPPEPHLASVPCTHTQTHTGKDAPGRITTRSLLHPK